MSLAGRAFGVSPTVEELVELHLPVFGGGTPPAGGSDPPAGLEPRVGADTPAASQVPTGTATTPTPPGGSAAEESVSTPFILGEGLPTVPAKLVRKIEKGEFLDMAELLRDNMEADRCHDGRELPPGESRRTRREVPDLLSWAQCFSTYAGVVTRQNPGRSREIFAYLTTVVRTARRCGGGGWREYDAMFRQLAANSSDLVDWSRVNTSIYAVSMLAQSGRGRVCPHCLEPDHGAEVCTIAPRQAEPLAARPLTQAAAMVAPTRSQGPPSRRRSEQLCYAWNEGRCSFPYCRYRHVCEGDHRSLQCRSPPKSSSVSGLLAITHPPSRGPLGPPFV